MSIPISEIKKVANQFYNAFTLVDLSQKDQPLVYVNEAFVKLTGYPEAEIMGKNCRFLQGPKTAKEDAARIHDAIENRRAIFCDLLNYRKDGSTFYNRLVLLPIELEKGPHFIGMQIDATEIVGKELKSGKKFDEIKNSDAIKDRINTPLMAILMAFSADSESKTRKEILERSFTQILDAVKAMPLKNLSR